MRKQFIAAAAATALAFSLAACGADDADTAGPEEPGTADVAVNFNEADIQFAQGMIPHHEQAVEMSNIILDKEGIDPRVTELAEQIKEAQEPEIELLESWLDEWDASPAVMDDMHDGHGMEGMMSSDDIDALTIAEGESASRLYIEQMIVHHEGAIIMAEAQLQTGANPAALELAQTIIDTQQAEIDSMRMLLNDLDS